MVKSIKELKRIVQQIWSIFEKRERIDAIKVLIAMMAVSVLELLGVSVIYSFIRGLMSPKALYNMWYSKWVYAVWPEIDFNHSIVILGMELIAIYLIKNLLALVFTYVQFGFAAKFQENESTLMLSGYLQRPYSFFLDTNSSEILRGINEDTASVYTILICIYQLSGEVLTITAMSIYLIIIDWIMALSILGIALICFVVMLVGFKRKIKKAAKIRRAALAERNKYSYQTVMGIKEILVMDRRRFFLDKYRHAAREYSKAAITDGFFSECPNRVIEGVCIGGFVAVVCIRVLFGVDMAVFIPAVSSFAVVAFKILPELSKVSGRLNRIMFHQPGLQHFYENVTYNLDASKNLTNSGADSEVKKAENDILFENSMSIKNISFKYKRAKADTLRNLSLNIKKGESIALIGVSGGGKTTLANIILGLLQPYEGDVLIDNRDIYEKDFRLSRIVGFVPQDVFLLDDTIRNNIAFGQAPEKIDDREIWDVLEQAQMKDFVSDLPKGLDTFVGERGVKFSGGQRQRMAIARALYNDPDILIFDEATSALDPETENAIIESIDRLKLNRTLIIIAHRLNTIRNCDRIYEIRGGKAIQRKKEEVLVGN